MWGWGVQVLLCISACAVGVVHACVPLPVIGDPFSHESFSWNELAWLKTQNVKCLLSHIFLLHLLPKKCHALVLPLLQGTAQCRLGATWWCYCISFRGPDREVRWKICVHQK